MLKAIVSCIVLFRLCCPFLVVQSDDSPASLNQYEWQNRVTLIFVDKKKSNQYKKQLREFADNKQGFQDRDLITLHLFADGGSFTTDQDISARDERRLRLQFNIEPSSFTIILLRKDRAEKLREDDVLPTNKLFNVIDAIPMRQQEMK